MSQHDWKVDPDDNYWGEICKQWSQKVSLFRTSLKFNFYVQDGVGDKNFFCYKNVNTEKRKLTQGKHQLHINKLRISPLAQLFTGRRRESYLQRHWFAISDACRLENSWASARSHAKTKDKLLLCIPSTSLLLAQPFHREPWTAHHFGTFPYLYGKFNFSYVWFRQKDGNEERQIEKSRPLTRPQKRD